MNKIKVLLVDDQKLFRSGLCRTLETYSDFEVVGEAGTGEEAVEVAAATLPNVILMDVDMPGCGGIKATKTILAAQPECRVLLLTGHKHYVTAGIQAGASGYLLKETDEDETAAAIRTTYENGAFLQPKIQASVMDALRQAETLPERDLQILRLVAVGTSNREIGDTLGFTESSVKQHINAIREKLGAKDRTHAAIIAQKRGLI